MPDRTLEPERGAGMIPDDPRFAADGLLTSLPPVPEGAVIAAVVAALFDSDDAALIYAVLLGALWQRWDREYVTSLIYDAAALGVESHTLAALSWALEEMKTRYPLSISRLGGD